MQIYTMARVIKRNFRQKALPLLKDNEQFIIQHELQSNYIKKIRRQNDTSFSNSLLAIYTKKIFDSINSKNSLSFGIIIGFDSPRFRNNYSIVMIRIKRSENISDYIKQIDAQIEKNKKEVVPIYNLLCTSNMQGLFKKKHIDCLFSPAFFSTPKGTMGADLQKIKCFNIPGSCALYAFACVIRDRVYISSTINTPEICAPKFSKGSTATYKQSKLYNLYKASCNNE